MGQCNVQRPTKIVFWSHCHEVEHRRKVRITLVDCLSEASFLERRTFREAQSSPKETTDTLAGSVKPLRIHHQKWGGSVRTKKLSCKSPQHLLW
jgi:hypothetical protein